MHEPPQKTAPLAIAALVLGLVGLSLPAIVCGHAALSHIRRSQEALKGYRLALAGLVLGYFFLVLLLLALGAAFFMPRQIMAQGRAVFTQADANRLRSALISYQIEHEQYPGVDKPASEGDAETISDARLLKPLLGENPRGLKFFYPDTTKLSSEGGYHDGWGRPYRILLDNSSDGKVVWKGKPLFDRVIVMSAGPDGKHGTPDDLGTAIP